MPHGFIAEQKFDRTAPVGPCAPVPRCIVHWHTTIPPGCASFEWNIVAETDNRSDEGEHTGATIAARKWAKSPQWAVQIIAADFYPGTDGGPLYGPEIDYMGARGRLTTGAGVLCVVGRATDSVGRDPADKGVAHLDAFFRLVPYVPDWGYVKLNYLIRSEIKCEKAILSMQGGDCIQFSDDQAVPVLRFDPATGICGWWKGRLCVQGVHAVTGAQYSMQTFP